MSHSSILGGEKAPTQARGRDTDALGPSDSSDSGSDVQGEHSHLASDPQDAGALPAELDSDTDAAGTGERGAAFGADVEEGADIRPDRIDGLDDVSEDLLDVDEATIGQIADEESDEETDEPAASR